MFFVFRVVDLVSSFDDAMAIKYIFRFMYKFITLIAKAKLLYIITLVYLFFNYFKFEMCEVWRVMLRKQWMFYVQ